MSSFSEIIESCCRFIAGQKMLQIGECVVAGISGGADSVLLFHVLLAMRQKKGIHLIVAHLNHGLRQEADLEMDFVREMCREHGVPFHGAKISRGALAGVRGKSVEMASRDRRKRFLNAVADANHASKIALGHTGSDHVETILMNIHRGTGIRGLGGILPLRGRIIRPMIFLRGNEVREILDRNQIQYMKDQSNQDPKFTRNRVRKEILSSIATVFGENSFNKWYQLSENAMNTVESMRFLLKKFLSLKLERDYFGLRIARHLFQELPEAVSREAILYLMEEATGSTFFATREIITRLMRFSTGSEHGVIEIHSRLKVVRSSKWLYFLNRVPDVNIEIHEPGIYPFWFGREIRFCRINGNCSVPEDSDALFFDENEFPFPFYLTPVDFEKDILFLNGNAVSSVRSFMKKQGIGKAERDWMPVLKKGRKILWIPEVFSLAQNEENTTDGNRIAVYFTS